MKTAVTPGAALPRRLELVANAWLILGFLGIPVSLTAGYLWYFGGEYERLTAGGTLAIPLTNPYRYYGLPAILQFIVAAGLLVSSIASLRLRPWARCMLEMLNWITVTIVFAFLAVLAASFFVPWPRSGAKIAVLLFGVATLVAALLSLPSAITIWCLRSPVVRAAFERRTPVA